MKSHKQHRLVQPQFAAVLVHAQGLRAQAAAENEGWPPATIAGRSRCVPSRDSHVRGPPSDARRTDAPRH